MLRKLGGEKVKVVFDIGIKSVDGISGPSVVFIEWKRGSKSGNHGETKRAAIKDRRVEFNETLHFSSTLYKQKKGYEAKNISFSLKEDGSSSGKEKEKEKEKDKDKDKDKDKKSKSGSSLAKAILDLAEFAGNKDEARKVIKLTGKKLKGTPTLTLTIRAKETELSPDEEATETDNSVGGAHSDDEEDVEDFKDDEDDNSSSSSSSNLSSRPKSTDTLKPSLTPRSSASFSSPPVASTTTSSTDVEKLREELEAFKKKEADLKKRVKELANENVDQEEQITELRKQLDDSRKGSSGSVSASPSAEEQKLKKRIKELANENVDMEEKITQLEKDLKEAREGGSKSSSSSNIASPELFELRTQIQQLNHDLKFKDAQIEGIKADSEKFKSDAEKWKSENDKIKSELEKTKGDLEKVRNDLEKTKNENERLKQKESSSKVVPVPVSSGSSTPVDESKVLELKKRIKELANENVEQDDTITDLKKEIQTLKEKLDKSVSAASLAVSASNGVDKKSSGDFESKKKITELSQSLQQKDDQISKSKAETDKLNKEIEKLRSELSEAKVAAVASTAAGTTSSAKEIELKKKIKELANENVDMEEKIEQLEKELNEAREANSSKGAEEDTESLKEEISQLESKVSKLKRELREMEEDSNKREAELKETIKTLEAQKVSSSSNLGSSSSSDKREREKLEKEIEKEREKFKKSEKELKELREKVKNLEIQIENSSRRSGKSAEEGDDSLAKEEVDTLRMLLNTIYTQTMDYSDEEGVGYTAQSLFKTLRDENGFQNEILLDKVIEALRFSIQRQPFEMSSLCYWLSNTCAFLHLIKEERVLGENSSDYDPLIDGVEIVLDRESETFEEKLEDVMYDSYSRLLHCIYDKLSSSLLYNILEIGKPKNKGISLTPSHSVLSILSDVHHLTLTHLLYDSVVQQLFRQIFSHINSVLLNEIFKGSASLITPSSGFRIKLAVSKLDDWLSKAGEKDKEMWSPVGDQLDGIRQAANLMVIDKSIFADAETLKVFPALNTLQIKKILETFQPDQMAPQPMPPQVADAIKNNWGLNIKGLSLQIDTELLLSHH